MLIGTNIRRDGGDRPDRVAASGSRLARFVPMLGHDLSGYLDALVRAGVEPFAVLAKESFGFGERVDRGLARAALDEYRRRYGALVGRWQVGNEFDLESESSWTLALSELDALGHLARQRLGDRAYLVVGGAGDGAPADEPEERLSGADLGWADAIAIHTYGQGVPGWTRDDGLEVLPHSPYGWRSTVRDLIDGYKAEAPEKDLWITEMGFRWDELGEDRAAAYCDAFLGYLTQRCPEVSGFAQFCLTDAQVNGFGLYTGEGRAHRAAAVFAKHAALGAPPRGMTAEEAEEEAWRDLFLAAGGPRDRAIVYAPHLGIVKYWREHHRELGSAVGPERPAGDGSVVYQAFALAVVKWTPDAGVEQVA
jgi:hypothetical protein